MAHEAAKLRVEAMHSDDNTDVSLAKKKPEDEHKEKTQEKDDKKQEDPLAKPLKDYKDNLTDKEKAEVQK
jgi:hypothetical protein